MTRTKHLRRGLAIGAVVVLLVTVAMLLPACGSGDEPAVSVTTLLPSPSASTAGSGAGGDASSSPGAAASPSSSPSGSGGSGSSGTSPKKITDKTIRGNILVRLSQDPSLRGFQFLVSVSDATVHLSGRVKTAPQKKSAEQIAVTEPGVKKVLSSIVITGGSGY